MLDNSNISLDNLLGNIICGSIVFHGVKLGFCTYLVDCAVNEIPLGWADFSDSPIIAAHIILRCKLTIFICGVGVNKLLALIDAVNRTCKSAIALRRACFHIGFCHGHIEFFKNVGKTAACDLVPFDRGGLAFGNDIADCRIHFLHHIRGVAADKDIFKLRQSVLIGYGVFIHGQTAKGSSVKVECDTLH